MNPIEEQNRINQQFRWRHELAGWLMLPLYVVIGWWLQRECDRDSKLWRQKMLLERCWGKEVEQK